jgi:hypothetical protein
MFSIKNLKQICSTALVLLAVSSSTAQAKPLLSNNSPLSETENTTNTLTILAQKNTPQLDNDPALVGLWVADAACRDNPCGTSPRKMLILPDGTFYQGDSQLMGIEANSNNQETMSGQWKTANRIVYARADRTYPWIAVSRYYIKDGKMSLTYQDGSREVWRKSY